MVIIENEIMSTESRKSQTAVLPALSENIAHPAVASHEADADIGEEFRDLCTDQHFLLWFQPFGVPKKLPLSIVFHPLGVFNAGDAECGQYAVSGFEAVHREVYVLRILRHTGIDDPDRRTVQVFSDKSAALDFAATLPGSFKLRETTLEDVFVEQAKEAK